MGNLKFDHSTGYDCRMARVSALRSELAIKTQQCRQIESALDVLLDDRYDHVNADKIANKILNANIGP
jgi:hypothetical protein